MPKLQKMHALKANIVQVKYTGGEPTWDNFNKDRRSAELLEAFNWYNYHFTYKEVPYLVQDYLLRTEQMDKHKIWSKVPDYGVPNAIGWLCRMICNGFPATEAEVQKIDDAITLALTKVNKKVVVNNTAEVEEKAKKKANIQDIMREKAAYLGGELEHLLDIFIDHGTKANHKITPLHAIKAANILPQHVPDLVTHWENVINEFELVQDGKDDDLNEGYEHFSKAQIRKLIKFCNLIIADLHSYVTFKKASKAPRKRKTITPTMQTFKLKYSKEFKELGLKSVKPEKIIGSKEVYAYSPKKRKLYRFVADEQAGNALMVKNSSLIGFDVSKTVMKTLRKPKDQIDIFMKATRPRTRKYFSDIRTVEAKTSGRFNDDMVILKIF